VTQEEKEEAESEFELRSLLNGRNLMTGY